MPEITAIGPGLWPSLLRDTQAEPMRKLEALESALTHGLFDPDLTRAGRFKRAEEEPSVESRFILALIYSKLHVKAPGSTKSYCGRADLEKESCCAYAEEPAMAKSRCKRCFDLAKRASGVDI